MAPYVSIILPTLNGMPLVERCLRAVLDQTVPWEFEVIVIDSSSTDGTWELLTSLPVTRLRIQREDFNHGETRNLGASLARGQYLVFLVQDAVPANRDWLASLVNAASLPNAAGSYSRQEAWPTDHALIKHRIDRTLPRFATTTHQQLAPGQAWESVSPGERFALATFQNNSSCISRAAWTQFPFSQLPFGEDLDWGMRVIRAGYTIVHEPGSVVLHSHDRSPWYEFKRAFADHELVARLFGHHVYPNPVALMKSWLTGSRHAIGTIWGAPNRPATRLRLLLRTSAILGAHHLGAFLGAGAGHFSTESTVWRRIETVVRAGV